MVRLSVVTGRIHHVLVSGPSLRVTVYTVYSEELTDDIRFIYTTIGSHRQSCYTLLNSGVTVAIVSTRLSPPLV